MNQGLDAPNYLSEREIPFPPATTVKMADSDGAVATDVVPSSLWAGVELDFLRPHLLRLASAEFTGRQLEVFTRWLSGEKVAEIAESLGVTHQVVSKHLNGDRRQGVAIGGVINKLRRLLLSDTQFLADLATLKATRSVTDGNARVREWFRGLRRQTLHQFVPRAVLLVLIHVADVQRVIREDGSIEERHVLSFRSAYEHLPPAVVSSAMPTLKALGYVQTDGVTIRILKTPLEEKP